jgi:protocatechuate 3,4-dioxygenase beta subunit
MNHDAQIEEPSNEELRLISRRSALRLMGGAGLAVMAGCTSSGVIATTTTTVSEPFTESVAGQVPPTSQASTTTFGGVGGCVLIPEETEGPYPLDLSGREEFVRADITEGHPGAPMTLNLTLVDVNNGCSPISGARVDVWHTNADGIYSGHSQPGADTTGETFCRGIQLSDDTGQVSFQTIYPGWYAGRVTHIHFQVFVDSGLTVTSQIAFPQETTDAVYAAEPYAAKGPNTSVASVEQDSIFSDGSQFQLASITGGVDSRLMATLLVGVAL